MTETYQAKLDKNEVTVLLGERGQVKISGTRDKNKGKLVGYLASGSAEQFEDIYSSEDVLGATALGPNVTIFKTKTSSKGDVRKLVKYGPVVCENPEAAEKLQNKVRQHCCLNNYSNIINNENKAPTLVLLVNPLAKFRKAQANYDSMIKECVESMGIQLITCIGTTNKEYVSIIQQHKDVLHMVGYVGAEVTQNMTMQAMLQVFGNKAMQIPLWACPESDGTGPCLSIGHNTIPDALRSLSNYSLTQADVATCILPGKGELKPHKCSLLEYMPVEQVQYASIFASYGLLANVDIGSRSLYSVLGAKRMIVGALKEVVKNQKHQMSIAYLEEGAVPPAPPADATPLSSHYPSELPTPLLDTIPQALVDDYMKTGIFDVNQLPAPWKVLTCSVDLWALGICPYTSQYPMNPNTKQGDGLMDLVYSTGGDMNTVRAVIKGLESGGHVDVEGVNSIQFKACVFVPDLQTSYLTVDGVDVAPQTAFFELWDGKVNMIGDQEVVKNGVQRGK